MKKAGGVVSLIGGIFGVLAAIATISFGKFAAAVQVEGASTVVYLGWGGVVFSFLAIILGSIAIGAQGKTAGVLLIISAIIGAFLGGTLVAIFMVLVLIGGVLAAMGAGGETSHPMRNTY